MIPKKIRSYIEGWKQCGYPDDIPDEVPQVLSDRQLAPSYRAIAIAILSNDLHFTQLGFSPPRSEWYSAFKGEEIRQRQPRKVMKQTDLFSIGQEDDSNL